MEWFSRFLVTGLGEHPNLPEFSAPKPVEIYTPEQQAQIIQWARSTKAPYLRAKQERIVCLAFGAGLRSRELNDLKVKDIEIDDQGVLIHVGDRVIPMVEKWSGPLRKLVEETPEENREDWVVAPRSKNRTYLRNPIFQGFDGGFHIDYRRMRSTWIGECMQAYVPESVVLSLSGMASLQHHMHLAPPDYSDPLRLRELFHRNESRSRGGLRAL